jgi:CRP/FNR family transcriptional regulator, cyclic AMP receptor protein
MRIFAPLERLPAERARGSGLEPTIHGNQTIPPREIAMTSNFAYSGCPGRQSVESPWDMSMRGSSTRRNIRDDGHENWTSSRWSVGRRAVIQGVNTQGRSPLFAQLRGEDVARLNARCLWRRVRAGEMLAAEATDDYALSVVANGRVRAVQMMNGREIILRDIEAGGCFGELSAIDGRPGPAQIFAITDSVVVRMPSRVFRDAVHQFPCFCDQVLEILASEVRSMNDRFRQQISLSTRERLCVELLKLSRRTSIDRIVVSPPPSHAELAARIGGIRETVTKMLMALEREGVISRSRGAIVLIDVPRLTAIAASNRSAA